MFLKENVKNVEIIQLKNELLISEYIENLNFISKENAVMIMKEEYGEDFIKDLGYNPLVDSIDINLKSEYVESTKLDSISNILSRNKYIDEIVYDKNLINLINKNIKKISFWLLPSIGVFLLFTFLIINGSIRLSIYSNRKLIKTMQLVGAKKSFIRKPFIKTNIILGLISSIISICLISLIVYYIDLNIDFIKNIDMKSVYILFIGIITLGFIISYISTFFATQNILKIKADRLDI
tara:strand:- start:1212 stop:1922 length:711 start_codon:yes stop_codon:yes gene_type:complete